MTGTQNSSDVDPSSSSNNGAETENQTDKSNTKTYFGYSKKQLTTIIVFAFVNLFASTVYSLQAPFYPKEAEAKGASATEYGFVLGVFQLTMFIMSPVFGAILGVANPRKVFIGGIFVIAICSSLFGFLDYFDDHATFIALSFVLRILQACGDAAFVTASFTMIAMEFPETVASTFAALETFWGLGMIVGPGLGGALYEVGGFVLPFLFMGGLLFLMAFITLCILPEVGTLVKDKSEADVHKSDKGFDIIKILRIPEVALAFFSVVIAASSIGFLVATLEPHLRENFGLTPGMTGLVFMIDGCMYAFFAPVWGRFVDKSQRPKLYTLSGAVLTFIGFLCIGPAPFIPLNTILWLVCVGLVIHGFGTGASFVSCFIIALKGVVANGLPDGVSTYGHVSGLFMSSLAFGSFVGPSIGGVLLDNYGFRWSSVYVLATQVIVVILTLVFICAPNAFKSKFTLDAEKELETEKLIKKKVQFSEAEQEEETKPAGYGSI